MSNILHVQADGTVLISVEAKDSWSDSIDIREEARAAGLKNGNRIFAICTMGGYVVDVWQVDHWQSGLEWDDGSVGWSPDMYVPNK